MPLFCHSQISRLSSSFAQILQPFIKQLPMLPESIICLPSGWSSQSNKQIIVILILQDLFDIIKGVARLFFCTPLPVVNYCSKGSSENADWATWLCSGRIIDFKLCTSGKCFFPNTFCIFTHSDRDQLFAICKGISYKNGAIYTGRQKISWSFW